MLRLLPLPLLPLLPLLLLLLPLPTHAQHNVSVIRLRLPFEEEHTVVVDSNTEYILDFVPTPQQSPWPARVLVSSDADDSAAPLLLTYRQLSGAGTWQLPWAEARGAGRPPLLHRALERTLCPDTCAGPGPCQAEYEAGGFSVHAVWARAPPATLRARASAARTWRLLYQHPLTTTITSVSPSVHLYEFGEDQEQVRLIVQSDDDVCATIAVHPRTCPIAQTLADIGGSTVRMTVTTSGAAHLTRARFPNGFYVVGIVHPTSEPCREHEPEQEDWLVSELLYGSGHARERDARTKTLTLHMEAALSRAQYVVATAVTLALFLGVYAVAGALVLLQRWPPFQRCVRPLAVRAEPGEGQSTADGANSPDNVSRPRRPSTATFDSSDNSDTDSDSEGGVSRDVTAPAGNGVAVAVVSDSGTAAVLTPRDAANSTDAAVPASDDVTAADTANGQHTQTAAAAWGLPAELRVAALARRRARVLRARADRYLTTLLTVAVFYALPVLQFVFSFQIFLNMSGSLDTCYYNFLCAHPAGVLSDFNHVFSNLGYLLLGLLFMLQLRRRQARRKLTPKNEEYGIPAHYGLLASLGAGMMVVALLSAAYHVCPNRLNFQFDTSFMYVLAVLTMVKIYQSRHPDVNARAHATFGVLAVLIALVVWGVLGGGALFWGVFTVLHVFTFLLLSLRIYYLGQFRFEKESLQRWGTGGFRPLYTARLVLLVIANAVNWAFAIYGLFKQSADFASHLLYVLLSNALMYMSFYVALKLLHGERPRWYSWALTLGAGAAWAGALAAFSAGASSWAASPALSRAANARCLALAFYDTHDLWHMLSALALYLSFNAMLTWDDGLGAVRRTDIAVF